MQEEILKFFNVEFSEIKELANRLTRVGNNKASLIFSDLFKLLNILELYSHENWSGEDKFIAISNYLEYENNDYRFSSLFAIPVRQEIHLKFRNNIAINSIDKLKIQFQGRKYKDLIQAHIREMSLIKVEMAILGSIAAFNSEEREIAEITIEEYLQMGKNKEFWHKGCNIILLEVCSKFKGLLSQNNYEPEDSIQFNMFQLLTMFFTSLALQEKFFRKHIGIKRNIFFR
jgi:hypothetical protein